ncbi:MAG: TetR/AcrR family transcriptional regulator [Spirochaetales bacterium]|nr:TetR/AcrR family transcriptional regulator [Spirochaetales bacterium]
MTEERPLSKSQRTKAKIFEMAWSLFKERGFDNVSLQDIADQSGTAKGSFYTYFSTKSDIIVEGFWMIDGYYRSVEREVLSHRTVEEKLLAFTELQLTYVRDEIGVEMLKVLYANQVLQQGSEKVITDPTRFWHTFIRSIIEDGQTSGECRTDLSSERYARFFNRSMRGLFLDWNIGSASFDLVEEGLLYCRTFVLPAILL